ncbi:hypothetical protein PN36_33890 [Candidatus Thiomargarita nelsonii]|uniref:Phosphoribosylanthranilate isomerase n=1 Tax=Candidatus Thiomargarita nelsonii TaxID=1003181 RepID=A0A0A6PC61_9GAMM|nr:hypothetical protein PN36_33890 [Candidatus Thiomargarita nelsonii]
MKPIIKVDRVSSVQEATELQNLGVNIIGVSLKSETLFDDKRQVSKEMACSIRECLVSAKLCGEVDINDDLVTLTRNCGFDLIQCSKTEIPENSIRKVLKELGVGLVYSGIEASYEDDPSWILSHFEKEKELYASYFHVDLLTDIDDSWNFLKKECPKYPDELQIDDINQIASQHPLIITLDFSANNIIEIIESFHKSQGVNFTLGTKPALVDFHWLDYAELIKILLVLKQEASKRGASHAL